MINPTTVRPAGGLTFPGNAPPAFHVLIKPTRAICNLDCKYCFFLSKEILYPGSRFQMAEGLLERISNSFWRVIELHKWTRPGKVASRP
jgi:sulfatase maturation enzyme AslB (radical SAM superfamily)